MTKNDRSEDGAPEDDMQVNEQPGGPAIERASDTTPVAVQPKAPFIKLHAYVLDMPLKVRLAIYNKIERAVKHGEVFGLVHPSDMTSLLVLDPRNAEVTRSFRQVLISNTTAMLERLEQLSAAAVVAEVIRTGGRNFSVDELQDMGDALDFDAMAAAARKREAARARTKAMKNRKRPKTNA